MSASYPKAIKQFTTKMDYTMDVMAQDVNDLQDEVVALESILGVNPHLMDLSDIPAIDLGPMNSLAARLSALESGITRPIFATWENYTKVPISTRAALTTTTISLDRPSESYDPLGWYNGVNGFQIKKTGWYDVTASIVWAASASIGTRRLVLYTNNTLVAAQDAIGPALSTLSMQVTYRGILTVGTQVRLAVTQNCGTVQSVHSPRLSGVFLREV
jgi:hypothetical protein